MKRRGFSIVELAIVIALISILSLLLFANLRNSQISVRDDERRAKAELVARSFEALYKNGNSQFSYEAGTYPDIQYVSDAISNNNIVSLLPNIDQSALTYSWSDDATVKLKTINTPSEIISDGMTENMSHIAPRVGLDEIVYEPLYHTTSSMGFGDSDKWRFCKTSADDCRRFNIYYRTEGDNTVHAIRSVNQ